MFWNDTRRTITLVLLIVASKGLSVQRKAPPSYCVEEIVSDTREVVDRYRSDFESFTIASLKELIGFRAISSEPGFEAEIIRTADHVSTLFKSAGLKNVRVNTVRGADGQKSNPYVYGERMDAPGGPTLLLYSHYDVVIANRKNWKTPPFKAVEKNGRIFGRGTTDNRSGLAAKLSAIAAYLKVNGKLPVNIKYLVEGEEESGSPNFERYVTQYPERIKADAILIADAGDRFKGIPAVAVSLRGILHIEIKVSVLKNALHSGIDGGAVPHPLIALSKIIAGLFDEEQVPLIPGLRRGVTPISQAEKSEMRRLLSDDAFRKQCGFLPGVEVVGGPESALEKTGCLPAISVSGIEVSESGKSTIPSSAKVTLSVRTVPGMSDERVFEAVKTAAKKLIPFGVHLTVTPTGGAPAWSTDPNSPELQMTGDIFSHVYGRKSVLQHDGGTLPLLSVLSAANGADVPVIVYGADEPGNNTHGNDESVGIDALYRTGESTIYLFQGFSEKGR